MREGEFCFLKNQYYIDFPDPRLMKNKEAIEGKLHDRPCYFCFTDFYNKNIYWLVPVSSKYEKYKVLHDKKALRYGHCNTIVLGNLLGKSATFLIQNMCPATSKYINEVYLDKNYVPVKIDSRVSAEILHNAHDVLRLVALGNKHIVFPDIMKIYKELEHQLVIERSIREKSQSLTERLLSAKSQAKELNRQHISNPNEIHNEPER